MRVIKPVKVGFQPYRDYIGSRLELLNVDNGHRSQIHSSRVPFEAPNWLPNGAALIYNASGGDPATRGRLWRFDLATRTPTLIDTGFAIRNNNDHVLSFDGKQLAISDQSQDNNQSTIYTLPVNGGIPKRITPLTPSYMHGGRSMPSGCVPPVASAEGKKDNDRNIQLRPMAAQGINSQRAASMMAPRKPDGRKSNSLHAHGALLYEHGPYARTGTRDPRHMHDRFRISRMASDRIISYGLDIAPTDHPYYRHCYLRLMPADGSAPPKVIAYVYGGQGTINVPSWSPDGTHIAFVSNSDAL